MEYHGKGFFGTKLDHLAYRLRKDGALAVDDYLPHGRVKGLIELEEELVKKDILDKVGALPKHSPIAKNVLSQLCLFYEEKSRTKELHPFLGEVAEAYRSRLSRACEKVLLWWGECGSSMYFCEYLEPSFREYVTASFRKRAVNQLERWLSSN